MTPRKPKPTPAAASPPATFPTFRNPDVWNGVPDLVELQANLIASNEDVAPYQLTAELRIAATDICDDTHVVHVGISALDLYVRLTGLDPTPGERFGEPIKANDVEQTQSTTVSDQTERGIAGRLAANIKSTNIGVTASATADASMRQTVDRKTTSKETSTRPRVIARPGLKWEVREEVEPVLKGTYIVGQALCSLQVRQGANQVSVTVDATVLQKDLSFDDERLSFFSKARTREKLIQIFHAKCMSLDRNKYAGRVVLSQVTIEADAAL